MDLTPDEVRLIEEHRRRKQPPAWEPRAASSYTTAEKCAAFDRLHAMALEHFNEAKKEGRANEDAPHYVFEAVMELLGKDVWKTYNGFVG